MLFRRLFKSSASTEPVPAQEAPASGQTNPLERTRDSFAVELHPAVDAVDALDAAGRHAVALAILDDALLRAPNDAWLHFRRGSTLFRWGRVREAREASLRAADLQLADEGLYRQIGWCHFWTSDLEGAERWMAKAVEIAPDHWKVQFGSGTTAYAAGRIDDAIARYTRALELEPSSADTHNGLVICHLDHGDAVAAEAAARRAIEADGQRPMAWANLGVALARQQRFDEARPPFDRALELESSTGDVVDSFVNYCNCLRDAGQTEAAVRLYERSLPDQPNVNAHGDYAFALMAVGRLPEGWREYEFRWMTNAFLRRYPGFDRPEWNGQDLTGKTILLWVEQGFGDTVQFIRYVPLVKALGATVLVVARQGLERLLLGCAGIDRIVSREEPLPPFDFHSPLMSLPRVFGTELDSIPAAIPYLRATPEVMEKWRGRLPATTKRRVGIVWAGSPLHPNDQYRSISLEQLRPVLETDGVQFVSLQMGPTAAQLSSLPPGVDVLDLGSELEDFSDTLAVIDQLDLVICVDTSVAHLAGALGKPTWILLPFPADFRWLEIRDDSPWYPSARLFRQDARRDWEGVVAQMTVAFGQWVAGVVGDAANQAPAPRPVAPTCCPRDADDAFAAHRSGFSAVVRARYGLVQYFPDDPVEGASLATYGEYRQGQLDFIATLVAQGSTVMEVCPGIGAHSIALARMTGPTGFLLAVEPRKLKHRVLRQNLATNGVLNATLLCRGLGTAAIPGIANAQALIGATVTGRVPETEGAVDSIDGLRLQHLEFLKINEDADAADVLAGAGDTLWRLRPRLFIGFQDAHDLELASMKAREFGYRCWRHESPLFNPVNFNLRETDVFLGRTVLAMVAIPEEFDVEVRLDGCTELT